MQLILSAIYILSTITSTPEETVQQMATCTYHFGIMGKVSGIVGADM